MSSSIHIRHFAPTIFVVMALAVLAVQPTAHGEEEPAAAEPILVVTSRDEGPYKGVVSGLLRLLARRAGDLPVSVHSLQLDAGAATQALQLARRQGTTPIVTVGSLATREALEAEGNAPVIACMTVDEQSLREANNATGVFLEFPLETQLKWMRRLVPKSKSIGVLYNSEENRKKINAAKRIAEKLGLRLVAREIEQPQDLPDALNSLAREADLLWGVTDQLVLSRKTAQAILLFSFRNRIPFSGLSASWVKAGALYALDRDYEDLGEQCGEMVVEILDGRKVNSIPPVTPRKVVYALNLRTAEHLRLEFPKELIEGAAQVFR